MDNIRPFEHNDYLSSESTASLWVQCPNIWTKMEHILYVNVLLQKVYFISKT